MAEPYNFIKHLREIVCKPLKELGFKQKGCWFFRESMYFTEKIYFQRSQFNRAGSPFMFYLNLYCGESSFTRMLYPEKQLITVYRELEPDDPRREFYTHYPEQRMEMSDNWQYSTEDELKHILSVALAEIGNKGFQYFLDISNVIQNKTETDTQEKITSMLLGVTANFKKSYFQIKEEEK